MLWLKGFFSESPGAPAPTPSPTRKGPSQAGVPGTVVSYSAELSALSHSTVSSGFEG